MRDNNGHVRAFPTYLKEASGLDSGLWHVTKSAVDDSAAESAELKVRDASPPFNKLTADVILRSSDLVDFHVRKAILAEASPFFDVMFHMPQPSAPKLEDTDYKNGPPVIPMTEDSRTLDIILRICYPVQQVEIRDVETLRPVLEAVLKYDMDSVMEVVKSQMRIIAAEVPLRIYALALVLGLNEEVRFAARCSLAHSVQTVRVPEFEEITAAAYCRLLDYRKRCSDAAEPLASGKNLDWLPNRQWIFLSSSRNNARRPGVPEHSCSEGDIVTVQNNLMRTTHYTRQWWWDHLSSIQQVTDETPSGKAVIEAGVDEAVRVASSCRVCAPLVGQDMRAFVDLYAAEVDKAVSQIELEIP
ncbi:hypothetical protein IEO21_02902 [Rhodonia placenta]|uniref:BTB domain-containing protein n=1 Tax=Rhodonia placenta TaxID=104341 RepID=A0A8H7P6T5_9APHY|nr:hypothetical protein IEO21_02902 [Postia placenta]